MILDRLVGIFGLLFLAAIAYRVAIVAISIRKSPVIAGASSSAHDRVHRVLGLIIAAEALSIILFRVPRHMPGSTLYSYLVPVPLGQAVQAIGLAIAFAGLAWSVVAQSQMGKNWRVGNDRSGKTEIVREGLYRYSRHPIYVGFMAVAFGLFLATPNVLTLVCAIATPLVLSKIARLEEEFQLARHGDAYRDL